MSSKYLMDHEKEGERVKKKTDKTILEDHLAIAGFQPGMKSIDIGCASGEVTREIARLVSPESVSGFDASSKRIKESIEHDHTQGIKNIGYIVGNAYDMNTIPDGTYDHAFSRFMFEYLKTPVKALTEMKRIVKPGGLVTVIDLDGNTVFHSPEDPILMEGVWNIIRKIDEKAGFDPFTGRKLFSYFYDAGLEDISVDIRPYHQIIGEIDAENLDNWTTKLDILEQNYKKMTSQDEFNKNQPTFKRFLDYLKKPDTITYSNAFIVQGKTPSN